jgi:hypothetical protein
VCKIHSGKTKLKSMFEARPYTDKTRNTGLPGTLQEAVGNNTHNSSDEKHILQEMSPARPSQCTAEARTDSSNRNRTDSQQPTNSTQP